MSAGARAAGRPGPPATSYDGQLTPGIVHLGVGGFHRSHQAVYLDELFRRGVALDWGVVGVCTTTADEALHRRLREQGLRWTVETRMPDGSSVHQVVGTLTEHLLSSESPALVLDRLCDPRVRAVTLTVTEGGYPVDRSRMELQPDRALEDDLEAVVPTTATGLLVRALTHRRSHGTAPFTVLSCDNLPHNGSVARAAAVGAASLVDRDLASWIEDEVDFPSSMVDRITPMTTDDDVARISAATGHEDACPVVAEPFRQWVLERRARGPLPPWEEAGVQVVDDVAPYELLKLRVLNGGHQALAWPALLLGHDAVHRAAADPVLASFLRAFLREEVVPTVPPAAGIDPGAYTDTVIDRFAHPFLPDTVARLAAHSGDRMPQFVLEAARESVDAGRPVPRTALLVACWWRAVRAAQDGTGPTVVEAPDVAGGLPRFLAGRHLGPLAGRSAFARQVVVADASIETRGVRGALVAASPR